MPITLICVSSFVSLEIFHLELFVVPNEIQTENFVANFEGLLSI